MSIARLFSWFVKLLMDQRGEIGDLDKSDIEGKDPEKEIETPSDDEKDDEQELVIKTEEKKSDEAKAKEKEKADREKVDAALKKELDELKGNYESLSKHKDNLNRAISELRQENKKLKAEKTTEKGEHLTDEQLVKILQDNPDDPEMQLRMMKYLAEKVAKGEVKEGVSAAEIRRKSEQFTEFLEDKYPALYEPGSEIRKDVDVTKENLGLMDHPFGDFFAVAVNVLTDLPELIDYAFNEGKTANVKDEAEKKRKEGIESSKLGPGKEKGKESKGLTESARETASQMELTEGQKKYYEKLVGKQPRVVSVED